MERAGARRLWRLRKLHQFVDAELHEHDGGEAELQLFLNGAFTYARRWPTRALAIDEARARRADLEREGWLFHW